MRIVVGCDEAALSLKNNLKKYLEEKGNDIVDVGVDTDTPTLYPDIAEALCKKITSGECERGLLLCGTGMGMAITANKIPGIRAAVAHDIFSLERMILSNNCQVLCMGARIIAPESAKLLLDNWLNLEFKDGRSTVKVKRIMEIEQKYRAV